MSLLCLSPLLCLLFMRTVVAAALLWSRVLPDEFARAVAAAPVAFARDPINFVDPADAGLPAQTLTTMTTMTTKRETVAATTNVWSQRAWRTSGTRPA